MERLRLSGKQDEGDLSLRHQGTHTVYEYKNVATWSYAKLTGYLAEAKLEAGHYAGRRGLSKVRHAVVLKVHGKGWMDGVVMMPMSEYLELIGESNVRE